MASLPSISYAKGLGLFGSGLLSGGNLYISLFAIPSLLYHPQVPSAVLHRQWLYLYNTGKATFPIVSIMTAVAFGFVSLYSTNDHERLPFAISTLLTLAIIPFTLVGMRKNLGTLLEERKVWGENDNQRLKGLIKTWRSLNYVRGALLTVAFGVALAGSVS